MFFDAIASRNLPSPDYVSSHSNSSLGNSSRFRARMSSGHGSSGSFGGASPAPSDGLFARFEVAVLHHSGPGAVYVRRAGEEEARCIAAALEDHCEGEEVEAVPVASLPPGRPCAVRHRVGATAWQRAVTTSGGSLRLLDHGGLVTAGQVHLLPASLADLATCPALAIRSHLYCVPPGLQGEGREEMEGLLAQATKVFLSRRGAAVTLPCGEVSLPMDLLLCHPTFPSPFEPMVEVEEGLVQLLGLVDHSEEEEREGDTTVEESAEEEKEFGHVKPMAPNPSFRWLPPALPAERRFAGRCTFVDSAGQIHLQLHSQRHEVRALRSLLAEKFDGSAPDSPPGGFREGQAVVVRWEDERWHRATFLSYREPTKASVVLVDYGDVFVAKVTELRATIYGERVPVLAHRTVLHNLVPADGGGWREAMLDMLYDTVKYQYPGYNVQMAVEVVGRPSDYPLPVNIQTRSPCNKCKLKNKVKACEHFVAFDVSRLLSSPEFSALGASRAADLAALTDPRLVEARRARAAAYTSPVAAGTYPEVQVSLLLTPTALLPPHFFQPPAPRLAPRLLGAPGELVATMWTHVLAGDRVLVQPWGEQGTELGAVVQAWLRALEQDQGAQDRCEEGVLVAKPPPGHLVASRWPGGRWCRAEVVEGGGAGEAVAVYYIDWGNTVVLEDWRQVGGRCPNLHISTFGHSCVCR